MELFDQYELTAEHPPCQMLATTEEPFKLVTEPADFTAYRAYAAAQTEAGQDFTTFTEWKATQ